MTNPNPTKTPLPRAVLAVATLSLGLIACGGDAVSVEDGTVTETRTLSAEDLSTVSIIASYPEGLMEPANAFLDGLVLVPSELAGSGLRAQYAQPEWMQLSLQDEDDRYVILLPGELEPLDERINPEALKRLDGPCRVGPQCGR